MHKIELSADVLNLIQRQRGTLHPFARLDLRHTAHIIVDLQNGFMEPGAPVEVPIAREIVAPVNRISAAMRERGGQNIFLRMTIDESSQASWSNWFAYMHSGASRFRASRMRIESMSAPAESGAATKTCSRRPRRCWKARMRSVQAYSSGSVTSVPSRG